MPVQLANHLGADSAHRALRDDVRSGLAQTPKTIPPKWFYDESGSALFTRITRLPEYYPTRTEASIFAAAAPAIAHSLFQLLGVFNGDIGAGKAVMVLALYVAFGLVALAVDRRALLVSSLAYVLYAMYALFTKAGAVEASAALTALLIGSALLLLSALWHVARRFVVGGLPEGLRMKLPYVDREVVATA